jgi:hypothetical protein
MAKGSTLPVLQETHRVGLVSKQWTTEDGKVRGGKPFTRGSLHATLTNVLYTGMVDHKGVLYADRINANDLRTTLAEFDSIWSSLVAKEQEQLIQLLVAKVGYDGRTGKVTVNFRSAGAKELCEAKS